MSTNQRKYTIKLIKLNTFVNRDQRKYMLKLENRILFFFKCADQRKYTPKFR